jgi:hypothetical protein
MKIGIFGDSYAEKTSGDSAWWRLLQKKHGHTVASYGTGGSSILYSVQLLRQHHTDYDFNIWCMTTPGRFSIPIPYTKEYFHSTRFMNTQGDMCSPIDHRVQVYIDLCREYLKHIFDWQDETLIGQALANYMLDQIPNLLIIPCFNVPINNGFNLYELCEKELQALFPTQSVPDIYKKYQDKRDCHLTGVNNEILSDVITKNLKPGIFYTSYNDFCFSNISLEETLIPL